jgi:hypothetical protein
MTIYETSILIFLKQLGHNTVGALEFCKGHYANFLLKSK